MPKRFVHYPNGSTTKGLEPHIEALKPLFVFAPDHKIVDHPIRIASGNWTAVMGTTMAEEWLFWDNQTFMKQLGLAQ